MGISAKEAAKVAVDYFNDFYSDQEYSEIRVEEVEREESHWFITLGFFDRTTAEGMVPVTINQRKFKSFKINIETGEVESMKIRKVE